ncbi:hypothetical protein GCM10009796_08210 [Microbacterium koreense]
MLAPVRGLGHERRVAARIPHAFLSSRATRNAPRGGSLSLTPQVSDRAGSSHDDRVAASGPVPFYEREGVSRQFVLVITGFAESSPGDLPRAADAAGRDSRRLPYTPAIF